MSDRQPALSPSALLLGATGLVGGHCLDLLLSDGAYDRVVVLVRRSLDRTHPKLEQHVADFDRLAEHADLFRVRDVFCCLGTTIRKAGSQDAFRKVDYSYPYEAARLAADRGAEQYLLVTSLGADAASRVFYSRVKGELEESIRRLPLRGVVILRPSFLLGEREEFRLGERIAAPISKVASPFLVGPLRRYRPIEARRVAAAMVRLAKERREGVHVVESDEIARLGGTA